MQRNQVPSGPSLLKLRLSVQMAPLAAFSCMLMSSAMPSSGWIGPWMALACTIGLLVYLLDVEFPFPDALVQVLVARVEAPGVAAHGHQGGLPLQRQHGLRVLE